ncbi:MAG: type II toxin-antitoxin system RelE/ParE family toxin [Deltaproteobacteria bacterium]|nr:type II toxin-antitoxin system RelE/ParE family toxin [Deltaproteobacteria bacterium]MBI2500492.1 type II toxin-antitoxin system RelE/ParE family toxin [Deltaproteobacteria bacterium]
MRYRIEVRESAERVLKRLDKKYQRHVFEKMLELEKEPRGHKCEKLKGVENGYRKVVWPYRILYTIDEEKKVVDVYLIAHRKEAYR